MPRYLMRQLGRKGAGAKVKALERNKRILIEWSAYGVPTGIEWVFTAREDGRGRGPA